MRAFTTSDVLCMLPFMLILLAFFFNLYRQWIYFQETGDREQPSNLEESTPLDYAIYAVLWLYDRAAGMLQKLRGGDQQHMPGYDPHMPADPLLEQLATALHLLVIGPSRSGKTSLVHALALNWRQTNRVIVCDPDAAPGLWNGCEVYGAGDDFSQIDKALLILIGEISIRRAERAKGTRQFAPLRVILCEYADIARSCTQAREIIEVCLRRGGKLNISLVIDVQDKQRKTLDLDGATHLLQNFSHICEIRQSANGERTAVVTRNDGEQTTQSCVIPLLPDLDRLVEHSTVSSLFPANTMVHPPLQAAISGIQPVPVQYGTDGTERIGMTNTSSTTLPGDDEAVAIRYLLQYLGSKNKVAEFLGGSKTTAYKRISRALGSDEREDNG